MCPGHETDATAWYEKACAEMACRNLSEAIICLPESTLTLPIDLLRRPLAITPEPLTVIFRESGKDVSRPLPTRSLFVYLTDDEPDLANFAAAFRDIAVVFAPVATR